MAARHFQERDDVPSILRYLEVYGNVNYLPHGTIWFKVVCRYCWQEEDSLTHSGSRDVHQKKKIVQSNLIIVFRCEAWFEPEHIFNTTWFDHGSRKLYKFFSCKPQTRKYFLDCQKVDPCKHARTESALGGTQHISIPGGSFLQLSWAPQKKQNGAFFAVLWFAENLLYVVITWGLLGWCQLPGSSLNELSPCLHFDCSSEFRLMLLLLMSLLRIMVLLLQTHMWGSKWSWMRKTWGTRLQHPPLLMTLQRSPHSAVPDNESSQAGPRQSYLYE